MNDKSTEVLQKWSSKIKYFGLILPDGWLGRPMDNAHELTWFIERKNKIIIEIDQQLYILLTKPVSFKTDKNSLIIYGFQQFVFDRQGYGDMTPSSKTYKTGEIEFVGY